MQGLHDAHVHLDFIADPRSFAADAASRGMHLFANTVTPDGYSDTCTTVGDFANVHVGLGLHPWWVTDVESCERGVREFYDHAQETAWIGEVGIDLTPRRAGHEQQIEAFERIAGTCSRQGGKVLSIHSVRAADTVIDILEETGCSRSCTCVFHWFSGSTEALWRAIRAGCWFSVNEMQARTRRAKEQLKLVPRNRLLLETDLPAEDNTSIMPEDLLASLERTLAMLDEFLGHDVRDQLCENWLALEARAT